MNVIEEIIKDAHDAAKAATDAYIAANPDHWYPCGFAWVNIRPATGPLVNTLKQMKVGSKGYRGGWEIWNPSGNNTQCMDAKFVGAEAFAEVLKRHGYDCVAGSRMD